MILPILTFAAYVLMHVMILGLCIAARRGDEAMDDWIRHKTDLPKAD